MAQPKFAGRGGRRNERGDAAPAGAARPPGLLVRELATDVIAGVLHSGTPLDEAMSAAFGRPAATSLETRDRALIRAIVGAALRFARPLAREIDACLAKPIDRRHRRVEAVLLAAAAQRLVLEMPAHAVISLAVEQTKRSARSGHLAKLVNAVLRRVSADDAAAGRVLADPRDAFPGWLIARWTATYGEPLAREIAAASLTEAGLDVTAKSDPAALAVRLGGVALATGSVRLSPGGRIEDLPGYASGDWWVQDAAAALPVRLLGDVQGRDVADLCAAPGGKTAELAAAGALVTALDVSQTRLLRLSENLSRLGLRADLVAADLLDWRPQRTFEAVLLDAPCSATGTIRRHPDILHLKSPDDPARLAGLQARLLDRSASLVAPGGLLVYCTCSLEPEEGEDQVAAFLARAGDLFELVPVVPGEAGIEAAWITATGCLRTLPCHAPAPLGAPQLAAPPLSGMDGFFAARLRRRTEAGVPQ